MASGLLRNGQCDRGKDQQQNLRHPCPGNNQTFDDHPATTTSDQCKGVPDVEFLLTADCIPKFECRCRKECTHREDTHRERRQSPDHGGENHNSSADAKNHLPDFYQFPLQPWAKQFKDKHAADKGRKENSQNILVVE